MSKITVLVTWHPGHPEDPRPVTLRTSWLPRLLGHDGVTLRRTVYLRRLVVLLYPLPHAPFLRHELTHIPQQPPGWIPWVWWITKYICLSRFRRAMEAEADLARPKAYPSWRQV